MHCRMPPAPLRSRQRPSRLGSLWTLSVGFRRHHRTFLPTAADATRILSRSQELLELELEYPGGICVADLRIVEHGHPEGVLLLGIGELHVVFAARVELAPEHARAHPVLVDDLGGDVAAVARERRHDDARHLVARLVLESSKGSFSASTIQ